VAGLATLSTRRFPGVRRAVGSAAIGDQHSADRQCQNDHRADQYDRNIPVRPSTSCA